MRQPALSCNVTSTQQLPSCGRNDVACCPRHFTTGASGTGLLPNCTKQLGARLEVGFQLRQRHAELVGLLAAADIGGTVASGEVCAGSSLKRKQCGDMLSGLPGRHIQLRKGMQLTAAARASRAPGRPRTRQSSGQHLLLSSWRCPSPLQGRQGSIGWPGEQAVLPQSKEAWLAAAATEPAAWATAAGSDGCQNTEGCSLKPRLAATCLLRG